MDDEIKINLKMADDIYPVTIDRRHEEMVREAAKQVNKRFNETLEQYEGITREKAMVVAAYRFALETLQLKERNDTEPYTDKIKELTEVLEAYFKEP